MVREGPKRGWKEAREKRHRIREQGCAALLRVIQYLPIKRKRLQLSSIATTIGWGGCNGSIIRRIRPIRGLLDCR